jgi:hypothetical protein
VGGAVFVFTGGRVGESAGVLALQAASRVTMNNPVIMRLMAVLLSC